MLKTQRNKKHRTIQNHAIRETVDLVKGKVSIFFFLGGNICLFSFAGTYVAVTKY